MSLTGWSSLLGAAFVAGMIVLMLTLFFVHGPRFWRLIATGLALVVGSATFFSWLVMSTFSDRV